MQVVRIHRFGGPDALSLDDLPKPEPAEDELLVRVFAASVNPVDYKIRSGIYPSIKQDQLPIALGRDVSGVVEICGVPANPFARGDAVYAMLGSDRGGHAEYVCVKVSEAALKPASLTHAQAASVPLAGLTAWQGLFDHGRLTAHERVLIHGGAGGVGHFAIQFAKAKGAWVATTVSTEDVDFARDLGANQAVDYRHQRFEDEIEPVDLVFDLIGGETQQRSWAVLKRGGRLISTLAEPSQDEARARAAVATRYIAQPSGTKLAAIGKLIDEGKVRPHLSAIYPLQEVAVAEERLEKEHPNGKIVLQIAA